MPCLCNSGVQSHKKQTNKKLKQNKTNSAAQFILIFQIINVIQSLLPGGAYIRLQYKGDDFETNICSYKMRISNGNKINQKYNYQIYLALLGVLTTMMLVRNEHTFSFLTWHGVGICVCLNDDFFKNEPVKTNLLRL